MRFSYIRLLHVAESCAFAPLLCDWIATPAIRVWRNRLGIEQWEWVGQGRQITQEEMEKLRRQYPLASYIHDSEQTATQDGHGTKG